MLQTFFLVVAVKEERATFGRLDFLRLPRLEKEKRPRIGQNTDRPSRSQLVPEI